MSEPIYTIHVSVEMPDSMIEEKLRLTVTDGKEYIVGKAEKLSDRAYASLALCLTKLANHCVSEIEESC